MQGKWALNIEFLEHNNLASAGPAIFYSCISRAHNDGNLSISVFASPCSLDKMTRHAKKMFEDYFLNLTFCKIILINELEKVKLDGGDF